MPFFRLDDGVCRQCDAHGPVLDGLCEECCSEAGGGPLSPWMVRLLFEETTWVNHNAWRECLDWARSRRGSEDHVTWLTLAGTLDEHRWARRVLEATEASQ
jgi:hypothetical protein